MENVKVKCTKPNRRNSTEMYDVTNPFFMNFLSLFSDWQLVMACLLLLWCNLSARFPLLWIPTFLELDCLPSQNLLLQFLPLPLTLCFSVLNFSLTDFVSRLDLKLASNFSSNSILHQQTEILNYTLRPTVQHGSLTCIQNSISLIEI